MTELCCLQSNAFDRWTRKPFESSPVKTLSCIRIIQLWIPIEGVVCLVSSRFLIRFASPGNGKGALQLFLCRLRELGYDEESDIGWPVWFVCLFVCFVASQTVWTSALEGALDERRRSYLNEGGDGQDRTPTWLELLCALPQPETDFMRFPLISTVMPQWEDMRSRIHGISWSRHPVSHWYWYKIGLCCRSDFSNFCSETSARWISC